MIAVMFAHTRNNTELKLFEQFKVQFRVEVLFLFCKVLKADFTILILI